MKHPFTVEDLYLHLRVTELNGIRGHDRVALSVQSINRDKDEYESRIWVCELDGASPRMLTQGPGSDTMPRWAPDGRELAFLSTRTGSMQIHVLPQDGAEARKVGHFDQPPTDLNWSPDGRRLYVMAPVPVDPDRHGARGSEPPKRGAKAPLVAWKLPYKSDGIGYVLAREVHLFCLDAQTGDRQQLTNGDFNVFSFDVSPDGRQIAYSRTSASKFANTTDLWVCNVDGTGHRQLTHGISNVLQPLWAPDGKRIVFPGAREEADAHMFLWHVDMASGEVTQFGKDDALVSAPTAMHWSQDGQAVLIARAWRGRHDIARVSVPSGEVEVLLEGNRQISGFTYTGNHFVFGSETMCEPSELHVCGADGKDEKRLSDFNPWWRDRCPLSFESREFEVPDGKGGKETIHGWLLRPRDHDGPLPLLNDVHGGPNAYALLDYDTNVFWQALCAQGWAILALNAVGSSSYGLEFATRLAGHWGEYDLPQHLEAVRQLQQEGVCDERVVVCGKSYGGFLSAWSVGHTEMFKAAVVMAPVGNIETHYGTSDGGYYADPAYMGNPQKFDRERARKLSPLQHVEKATTPTLFMQGADDERCPKCQSEEMFVSMYRAGKAETQLVLYPGEDHHFLGEGTPSVREDAANRIIAWVKHHVDGQAPASQPQAAPEKEAEKQGA